MYVYAEIWYRINYSSIKKHYGTPYRDKSPALIALQKSLEISGKFIFVNLLVLIHHSVLQSTYL